MNRTSRSLASPLANRVYRHLYLAQVSALTGTGVMTVGLALLAYQLAGEDAGAVLGIALSLRIVAFVLISPLIGAYAHLLPGAGCWWRSICCVPPRCSFCPWSTPSGRSTP